MSIDYRPDNTIVFTLARMNPPTPGHLYLIQRLIEEGIKKNVDKVYVILSKTNDNNENPISCSEKINVLGTPEDIALTMIKATKQMMLNKTYDEEMKRKITNMVVECICVPEVPRATPFTPVFSIIGDKKDIPDLNLFIVIGDDRATMLDSVTDVFFKWENVKSIDGLILDRPNMGEFKKISSNPAELSNLNISDIPVSALSASFVRNLVKNNMRDKFIELYSPYLEENKIPVLYEAILEGLSLPPNTKKEGPPKPLKYKYPTIKGMSFFGNESKRRKKGGRKTRKSRKSRKSRKTRKTRKTRRKYKKFSRRYKKGYSRRR
jgi:nicotinic acid mononucleotide adenylyltransferase